MKYRTLPVRLPAQLQPICCHVCGRKLSALGYRLQGCHGYFDCRRCALTRRNRPKQRRRLAAPKKILSPPKIFSAAAKRGQVRP